MSEQQVLPVPETLQESIREATRPELEISTSSDIGELVGALAKAQGEFRPIRRTVENVFYSTDRKKAMYADLAAIIEATQTSLAKNGLVIIQIPVVDHPNRRAGVQSIMAHSSGQRVTALALLPATAKVKDYSAGGSGYVWKEKFDSQTIGIAVTYCRRYTYQSFIGVAAEEDDDANSIGEAANGGSAATQAAVGKAKVEQLKKELGKPDVSVTVVSYPEDHEGDVEVAASEEVAKSLGLKRPATTEGHYWVKFSGLTKFYDKCATEGVSVREKHA